MYRLHSVFLPLFMVSFIVLVQCASKPPRIQMFDCVPPKVQSGEECQIRWIVENAKDSEIRLSGYDDLLPPTGYITMKPDNTTYLTLQVSRESNPVCEETIQIQVASPVIEPPAIIHWDDSVSRGQYDGRFTIGAGNRRLLYGYPIPFSTSHFVVVVDGQFACNSPHFENKAAYLRGELITRGETGSIQTEIAYHFHGVDIIQRLIPVDPAWQPVPLNQFGQYYRIEYMLQNKSDTEREVGLMLLLDIMIDDNDASRMDADDQKITRQALFSAPSLPRSIFAWRTYGNEDDLYGEAFSGKVSSETPDRIYIGRWPYFYNLLWDVQLDDVPYDDSAILFRWEKRPLKPQAIQVASVYYGLPNGQLSLLNNQPLNTISVDVYFDFGQVWLHKEDRAKIKEIIDQYQVKGVLVHGYADAYGTDAINMALSLQRARAVRWYLMRHADIPGDLIIPKGYGEVWANQNAETEKKGDADDRKGQIIFFY